MNQHIEHLVVILNELLENHFYLKESKRSFAQQKIEYLGHIVTHNGVQLDLGKVEAVHTWEIPKSIKVLRAFLDLSRYSCHALKWG